MTEDLMERQQQQFSDAIKQQQKSITIQWTDNRYIGKII